jgi:hypothetical protein
VAKRVQDFRQAGSSKAGELVKYFKNPDVLQKTPATSLSANSFAPWFCIRKEARISAAEFCLLLSAEPPFAPATIDPTRPLPSRNHGRLLRADSGNSTAEMNESLDHVRHIFVIVRQAEKLPPKRLVSRDASLPPRPLRFRKQIDNGHFNHAALASGLPRAHQFSATISDTRLVNH